MALVENLRALGREACLFMPPHDTAAGIRQLLGDFDPERLVCEAALPGKAWDCIILDRYQTPASEFSRWKSLAPVIGIDEGGPCRDHFDFLIDILPGLHKSKPNISCPSLLPFFPKDEIAHNKMMSHNGMENRLRVLVSFGQEDRAGLGFAAARALAAENSGALDITLLSGALDCAGQENNKDGALQNVRMVYHISRLGSHLAEYDLVITHYGITAFESLYAGVPVLLASPDTLHEKLAQAAGFCSLGTGREKAARIARLLFADRKKKSSLNSAFLQKLRERCAGLAERYNLSCENRQTLAQMLKSFVPMIHRNCPVCDRPARDGKCMGRSESRSFRRCAHCGAVFMNRFNAPPIEYAKEYFFDFYKNQYGKTYIEDFPNLLSMAKRRMDVIKTMCAFSVEQETKPALLDIGCAYGPFLLAAKEAGFLPAGIDPVEDAVRYVREELGIDAVHGFFPLPNSQEYGPFDAVTLWYVIEHFRECPPVLDEISRMLKPGGVLAFATPSFSGVSGRASLERFLSRSPADHWTIWAPGMCKKALARAGFIVKKIIVSGHHPERFPLFGKYARNKMVYAMLLAISKLFRLGDTFEVYAAKK
jgi:2-polyprenyl-3-methyl-5-hydroxy-6-metoxy-1,4-benzoquinol methylase/spore coat polysaccharide biosynthesis predicted glycosyltransferase SpsG